LRQSKILKKLRAGEAARLCSMGHFLPAMIRHAAHFRFDGIWLDLEHRTMSDREVQSLLAYFHLYDIDCLLRAPTLEKTRLYRYLEDGAAGLMIPHVSTEEKARALVDAVKFPPLGDRGLDGAGLDSGFYVDGGDTFPEDANRETLLVVQIETPEAIENVDAIAAVDGIDGLFIGPGDLGMRLNRLPDDSLTLEKATEKVAAAAARHSKAWGAPARLTKDVQKMHDQGGRLIAHGGDFFAISQMLENSAASFDQALQSDE